MYLKDQNDMPADRGGFATSPGRSPWKQSGLLTRLRHLPRKTYSLDPEIRPVKRKPKRNYDNRFASALRIQNIIEQESRRIAQLLHDESSQMLAVLYLDLAALIRDPPDSHEALTERVAEIREHLDEIRKQIRNLSHEVRPLALEQEGLEKALDQLAKSFSERHGIAVCLDVRELGKISWTLEIVIYRAVQEALINAERHARATRVDIVVYREGDNLVCSVRDNGVGFHPRGRAKLKQGLGLTGIRERALALRGKCDMQSLPGGGAEIMMRLPV